MNENVNYIVSGLERSGTSLMMQILEAGGIPVAYDASRGSDIHNPKGYYELEGGKIIDKLKLKEFPMEKYRGKFIKVTSFGLDLLPKGKYEIIYMIRNTDEVVESTIRMSEDGSKYDREELRKCLLAYDKMCLEWLEKNQSPSLRYTVIFFNTLLFDSSLDTQLHLLQERFPELDIEKAKTAVDKKLYRSKIK